MKKNQRMKHSRRHPAIVLLLTIAAVFFSMVRISAADGSLFLQGYDTGEDRVFVYCASLADIGESYDASQFTAKISGRECPVLQASAAAEEEEGITFYCLVDVSGSMYREQMAQAKEVLLEICEGLGENDNMVIGALGTTLETTDFLVDKGKILETVDNLTANSEYTAIYDAVIDSISVLQSSHSCNRKKCLILISDGDDETVIGKTRSEVLSAIQISRIPVYTVAALRQSYNEQQIEAAENLGAFARQSAGGRDYAPVVDGMSTQEVGAAILKDNRDGLILTLDVSEIETAKDELLLQVTLETDSAAYRDTMYLYTADLQFSSKTEDVPKEPEPLPVPEEPKQQDLPQEPGIPVYWLIIAAAVIAAAALAVILYGRKKKAQKEAQAEGEKAAEEDTESVREEANQGQADMEAEYELKAPEPEMTALESNAAAYAPQYEVKLIAIDHEDTVFVLRIPEDKLLTIGRNSKADLVLNPEDRHLSSIHCRVRCMQNAMHIWDMNSQNGTFVNGVPIRQIGMATVQNGDSIRMGSYEYRVYINR